MSRSRSGGALDVGEPLGYANQMTARQWQWLKASVLFLVVAGLALLAYQGVIPWRQCTPTAMRSYVLSFGWWSPLVYVAICAQPVVPLPASVMLMAGGLAFGLAQGALMAFGAILCRAIGQFVIARRMGRGAVETLLRGRVAAFDAAAGRNQFETVLWLRVIPNVPFDLQNLCLGLSPVGFRPYALATAIALVPGVAIWVYLGHHLAQPGAWWKIAAMLILPVAIVSGARWMRQRRGGAGIAK